MGEHLTIGPFAFRFLPDGDDPGVGALQIDSEWWEFRTPFDVLRTDWEAFKEAAE